jgi:hypothetical protein
MTKRRRRGECGTVDLSDGVRIYDSKGREVVIWTPDELEEEEGRIASEGYIEMTKQCRVDEIKKMIGWKPTGVFRDDYMSVKRGR